MELWGKVSQCPSFLLFLFEFEGRFTNLAFFKQVSTSGGREVEI